MTDEQYQHVVRARQAGHNPDEFVTDTACRNIVRELVDRVVAFQRVVVEQRVEQRAEIDRLRAEFRRLRADLGDTNG